MKAIALRLNRKIAPLIGIYINYQFSLNFKQKVLYAS